jgi:exosortase A
MHADLQLHQRAGAAAGLTPNQAFAAVAAVLVALLAAFAATTAGMVRIWYRSETFTHGFLVIPAVLWFVWNRRAELARQPVQPSAWALLPLGAAGALWLLGELSSSLAPSQLALIAMVPATLAALVGWRWVRTLAFPLAFLFFAVPFGEFLVPTLIDWTADFTVAAVAASGVPVYREANNFVIPTGRWSVVEACSGIRYLIASTMLGSLFAWITYRSTRKRLLFIAAAIAVPLVANWLRAYGIVMLGHLSDNRIATGVDHLIYGWLFFGVLITAMFWIGARWRDDDPGTGAGSERDALHGRGRAVDEREGGLAPDERERSPARDGRAAAPPLPAWTAPPLPSAPRTALARHAALVAVVVLAWPALDAVLARRVDARPVAALAIAPAGGWTRVDGGAPGGWRPDVAGAARTEVATFARGPQRVTVTIAVFRNQRQGAELVSSSNQLVHQDNERWTVVDRRRVEFADAAGSFPANAALIRGQGTLLAAAQWYWTGAERTVSDAKAKADLALDRLLMRGDTAAWIALAAPAGDSLRDALPVLDAFVRDMGAPLSRALAQAAAP